MNDRNLAKILHEALAIETQEAREAGALSYMARVLVQANHAAQEGGRATGGSGEADAVVVDGGVRGRGAALGILGDRFRGVFSRRWNACR